MTYDQALAAAKLGRAIRRTGWRRDFDLSPGVVRCEGIMLVRIIPDCVPFQYKPSSVDRVMNDWEAS